MPGQGFSQGTVVVRFGGRWPGYGYACAIAAAFALTPVAAAAQDKGGLPARHFASLTALGAARPTAQLCLDASVAGLSALGYQVRAPAAERVVAQHPVRALSVTVLCSGGRMGQVLAAEDKASDPDGKNAAEAAQQAAKSIEAQVESKFEGGRSIIRLKPGVVVSAGTYRGAISPFLTISSFNFPFPVSCRDLDRVVQLSVSSRVGKPLSLAKMRSATSGLLFCDGSFTGSEGTSAVFVAQGAEGNARATKQELDEIAARLNSRLPEIAMAPRLMSEEVSRFPTRQACLERGAYTFREVQLPAISFGGILAGENDSTSAILTCRDDGSAWLAATPRESSGDVSYLKDRLSLDDWAGSAPLPAAAGAAPQLPHLAQALLAHPSDVLDCSDAVSTVLAGTSEPRKPVVYRPMDTYFYNRTDAHIEGSRVAYPGRLIADCSGGWVSLAIAVHGAGGVNASSDLAEFVSRLRPELARPRWRRDERMGVALSFPRTATASAEKTAQGKARSLTLIDGGARYVARWVDDPASSTSDPQAKLDELVANLATQGALVRDTRNGFYQNRPSVAVWSQVTGEKGEPLRSVARYVVLPDNRILAVEVAYPEGVDVAASLGRFSDSVYF